MRYYLTFKAEDYYYKCSMVFFIQFLIVTFIGYSALTPNKAGEPNDGLCWVKPDGYKIILRVLCAYLFHVQNYDDVCDAFRRLKFIKNNPHMIENKYLGIAFTISMYQFWATFLCEIVNIMFLTRQDKLTDIIMNYVAFASVSQLDNVYCSSVRMNVA